MRDIKVGNTTFDADQQVLKFVAGSGITLAGDFDDKTDTVSVTITGSAGNVASQGQLPSQVFMPQQYNPSELNAVPGANTAVTCPFWVERAVTVNRLSFNIGVSSGNFDVGIYAADDTAGAPGTRIVSSGATVSPGAVRAAVTIGTTVLQPGQYWSAFAADNGTIQITYVALFTIRAAMVTRYNKVSSYPLPSSLAGSSADGSANTYIVTPIGV